MDLVLTDSLVDEFKTQTGKDPTGSPKAMTKFFRHANIAKKTLSANKEAHVIINGVYDGIDFKTTVKRETLE